MISYSFSFSYLNRKFFFLRQEAKSMLWHVCFTRDRIFVAISEPTSPGWLCGWSPGWNASSHCVTEALQRKSLWCTVHYQSPVPFVLLLRILKVYLVFITSLVFPLMVPTGRSAWVEWKRLAVVAREWQHLLQTGLQFLCSQIVEERKTGNATLRLSPHGLLPSSLAGTYL